MARPVVDGKVVTAAFPWDAVSDLGAVWNSSAQTTVEGEDADYCPSQGLRCSIPRRRGSRLRSSHRKLAQGDVDADPHQDHLSPNKINDHATVKTRAALALSSLPVFLQRARIPR